MGGKHPGQGLSGTISNELVRGWSPRLLHWNTKPLKAGERARTCRLALPLQNRSENRVKHYGQAALLPQTARHAILFGQP